jgi:hypothetical protein
MNPNKTYQSNKYTNRESFFMKKSEWISQHVIYISLNTSTCKYNNQSKKNNNSRFKYIDMHMYERLDVTT